MTTDEPAAANRLGAPSVFKALAILTFSFGALLHATNVIIGPERFVRDVFTPGVDAVFATVMIAASIAGFMSRSRFAGRGALRVGFWFVLLFITVSIPIHVRTVVLWRTDWALAFPKYYSHVEVPMFVALAYLVTRFRFRR